MATDSAGDARWRIRVVNIYAVPWRLQQQLAADEGEPHLPHGFEKHYRLYREQLPRLLPTRVLGTALETMTVEPAERSDAVDVSESRLELYVLPSKQVVLAVTIGLDAVLSADRVAALTGVLEQCITGRMRVGRSDPAGACAEPTPAGARADATAAGACADATLAETLHQMFATDRAQRHFAVESPTEAEASPIEPLLPECHQLVFIARSQAGAPAPDQSVIDRIMYRTAPQYRREFVDPRRPRQLNDPPPPGDAETPVSPEAVKTLGFVTPHVSLLYGHDRDVAASVILSTVHAVGTAARFRQIWCQAYQQVLEFRESKQKQESGIQTRDSLEDLADNLGNLEFDLTFSVEFPLMRIETFRSDLYEVMDISTQAKTLSQMFNQLDGSLRSEITAIEVRERRRDEERKRWNSVAAGLLSLIGVPVGFVLAFLGMNAAEVRDDGHGNNASMWSPYYATIYLVASAFALTPVFLIAVPYLKEWVYRDRNRLSAHPLWVGCGVGTLGALAVPLALSVDQHGTGFDRVVGAAAIPVSCFVALLGLVLVMIWLWRWYRQRRAERRAARREHDRTDTAMTAAAAGSDNAAGTGPREGGGNAPDVGSPIGLPWQRRRRRGRSPSDTGTGRRAPRGESG